MRITFCATHCQCLKKLSRSSLHLIIGLIPRFRVCPRGRPKRNAGCPTVVCYSRQITSPIPFEIDYHFYDILYFVSFCADLLGCFMISPCDVSHDSLTHSLQSLKVCCFVRLQVSHAWLTVGKIH